MDFSYNLMFFSLSAKFVFIEILYGIKAIMLQKIDVSTADVMSRVKSVVIVYLPKICNKKHKKKNFGP